MIDDDKARLIGIAPAIPRGIKADGTTFERQMAEIKKDKSITNAQLRISTQAEAARREGERRHNIGIISEAARRKTEAAEALDRAVDEAFQAPAGESPTASAEREGIQKQSQTPRPGTTTQPEPETSEEEIDDDPYAQMEANQE